MQAGLLSPRSKVAAFVASSALAASWWAAAAPAGEPAPSAVLPVATATVELANGYAVREQFAGRVTARRISDLGFERGGRIEEVAVDEGAAVTAGQRLARLDTRALEARRRELEAQRQETRSRLELARLTLERNAELARQDSVSTQRYDEARTEASALESRLAAVQAALEALDVDLSLSQLTAPYDGSIVARDADEGSSVSPGQRILQIVEDAVLEARIGVPADMANALVVGGQHEIETDGGRHRATLAAILSAVDAPTRTVTAVFRFEGRPEGARHGALARVALERDVASEGFWLPLSALAEGRRGLWSAYVVVRAQQGEQSIEQVERRDVQLLHTETDRVFVRGTLRPGERVVVTGLHRLVPGMRVRSAAASPIAQAGGGPGR